MAEENTTSKATDQFPPEYKAIMSAESRSKRTAIITTDLDGEFRKLTAKSSPYSYLNSINPTGTHGVNKITPMRRTASAFSIDRVFDIPHNPFRSRLAVETPQNLFELHQRFRYYFQREPLVGTAIELHSEFPLSNFQLVHDDPGLEEEFNDIAEDLNLFEFLMDMALEYHLVGECIPFGIFDDPKHPQIWKSFVLLNPLNVEITHVDLTDGRPNEVMKLRVSENIKDVVRNGPSDSRTGALYNRIPSDVIDAVKNKNGLLDLPSSQVSHFKRKGNYFKVRGESMLMRIMHLLSYRDKLRDAQYANADRHTTPREVWKVGETGNPATEDELLALANLVSNSYNDPNQAIVWHHALQVDVVGTGDKIMPLRQELDQIEEEMLLGLMLNKGFLDSNYGAYANMSVALDMLVSRYLYFRQRLERWVKEHVFAPLCRIHNIYKPSAAEIAHRIRVKDSNKRPWVPDITWDKHELRDSTQKVNLLMQLRDKLFGQGNPGVPADLIYRSINLNPKRMRKQLGEERKRMELDRTKLDLKGPQIPDGGAGGMPELNVDMGALDAPIGEIPVGGEGALPVAGQPEGADFGGGVEVQPPESANVQQTGTGNAGGIS